METNPAVLEPYDLRLTQKQEVFVAEYLVDHDCQAAAIRAGYAEDTAKNTGWRLIRNRRVQIAMRRQVRGLELPVSVEDEAVIRELVSVAMGADVADFEPWLTKGVSMETLRENGVDTSVVAGARVGANGQRGLTLHNKLNALKTLAQIRGMFVEPEGAQQTVQFNLILAGDERADELRRRIKEQEAKAKEEEQ